MRNFFKSEYALKLYKFIGYAIVEVLASEAFILLLQSRIEDQYVYGVVIVVVLQIREMIKALLGEKNTLAKYI